MEQFDLENRARTTLAQILGGIVLLARGFATWRNLVLAQQGQITDRFTKAIEQLGAVYPDGKAKLDVRVGGIYALERIANDSERDHWPIIEVLCAYVREHAPVDQTPTELGTSEEADEEGFGIRHPRRWLAREAKDVSPPGADIQAILTVLGRRNRSFEKPGQFLNLRKADLRRADLYEADLSEADLYEADLSEAMLYQADFRNSSLTKADLRGAFLVGAYLGMADLSEAHDLTQEQIDKADGDSDTKLPADLHMPESWKK